MKVLEGVKVNWTEALILLGFLHVLPVKVPVKVTAANSPSPLLKVLVKV
jgi:hypothetical protein